MAKIITKAVTRLQKFLAAIAGDAVAPTPITNQEKLLFNIAEEMKAASASDLPDIGSSDKNKFLHTNESTGALEWAEGGSGGGVLVVHDVLGTLDKTWQEIANAVATTGAAIVHDNDGAIVAAFSVTGAALNANKEKYYVIANDGSYDCDSASGYPKFPEDNSGPMM